MELLVAASAEEQFRAFSKHHQRAVRKAEKSGIQVRMITSEKEAAAFADIYIRMYRHRGLHVDPGALHAAVTALQQRFTDCEYADGALWGIYTPGNVLAGGIIVTVTGDTAFYYMGSTDPEQRSLPLLHIAFMNVIDECRRKGVRYFDFGGFAAYATADSQEEKINRFKIQFGGELIAYMPRLYFDLVPGGTKMLRFLRKLRN
ncbi:GNAT family N-acetyltransferase [Chitinophagaceae bacterium MMS25-I14]